MKKPKISVLMAAHNQEQFIKKSIKSILNQSFKDFEFLILDDASKDKTLNIIKKFQKEDKRIRLFRNEKNLGLTKSLIKLTRLARGEFIARMDSDDISLKSRFNDQISWFENDKKKVLVGTSGFKIDNKDKIISNINLKNLSHEKIKKKLIFSNFFLHSSTMFKKKIFLKIGGYRSFFNFAQDYDLWCRLSRNGKIGNLEKKLIKIRYHEKSLSKTRSKEQIFFSIIASCCNYYPKLKLKSKKKLFFEYINNINKLKKHFNCLKFLYSSYLPKNQRITFFQLNLNEKFYLLNDIRFLIIKLFKK